jgi:glycine cleavage system aminomethyltransferase T
LSVDASRLPAPTSLDPVLRQAGAVLTYRNGHAVVANYGSAAGELAACVSAVGLADCSELTKLTLEGPPAALRHFASQLAGAELALGGAVFAGGAWWCAERPDRLLVICDAHDGEHLRAVLHARVDRRAAVDLVDRSSELAALAVVGRHAPTLLAELGVYGESGDPRLVPPLTTHAVAGTDVLWLLESDHKTLALMPSDRAASVWHTIEHAGQRFGVCAIGREALARYALIRQASTAL